MSRHALVAAALITAAALPLRAHDFSVDPTSPEVLQLRYGSSDIIDRTGGGPVIFAASLGLGSDELDGFSYGKDVLRPVGGTNFFVSMQYSVSRATSGAGQIVTTQRNLNGAAGDKFNLLILRSGRTIGPFLESDAPNHKLTPGPGSAPGQSEIDGLSFPSGWKTDAFWTVARNAPSGRDPADVYYIDPTQAVAAVVYATRAQLGLAAGDNIDAIAVKDGGTRGVLDAADVVYVSLDAASPTRVARGGQDDILQVWPQPIAVAIAFNKLDIQGTLNEEIDAITGYDPGRDPKDPYTGLQGPQDDDPGDLIATKKLGVPSQSFTMLMGDLQRAGSDLSYFGVFNKTGYWTTLRPGFVADPLQIVITPFGWVFISPWHVEKGDMNPWSRGSGYASSAGVEQLAYYSWSPLGFREEIVASEGDFIPGTMMPINGFYRCGLTAIGTWRSFFSGLISSTGGSYWAAFSDDATGPWQQAVTLLSPGDTVGTKTIARLDRMDGAVDPNNSNVANFYGGAVTTTDEKVLIHFSATWTASGPVWGLPSIVADSTTALPGANGSASYIGAIAASSAVFRAMTSGGQEGIYKLENGVLKRIADKTTPVPGGSGTFTGFGDDVSNDEGATSFVGQSAGGSGIYTDFGGRLQKVVQVNDVLEGHTVTGVRLERDALARNAIAFGARFASSVEGIFVKELAKPFDVTDATQRAIHVDVELDPDPSLLGPDPRAVLVGDLGTLRLRGIWKSNGTTGTVTIPGSEVARLLSLQFGLNVTSGIGEWVTTIDIATGAILSSTSAGALSNGPFAFNADTNGGPWTSPLVPAGIPGAQAGFETNASGQKLFCSDAFSQVAGGACGAGAFGFPAASAFDRKSGFVHMTGPVTLGNSVLWGFLGDQRWVEGPVTACADVDSDGVCDTSDNCPFEPNANQLDVGGVSATAAPDGRGDACQCGDVSGNGRVTTADATLVTRAQLVPPTATLAAPDKCNVGGSAACTTADATILTRSQLVPPTATAQNICAAAVP
jgi:hypothetical protein